MKEKVKQFALFTSVLLSGLTVFVLFSHIRPLLDESADIAGRACLILALLISALAARRSSRFKRYWQILFAFFTAALATSIDYYLPSREWVLDVLKLPLQTPAGIAVDKLDSSIIIIGTILLLTRISGSGLDSVYINRRNLKRSISVGLITFLVAAAGSVLVAKLYGAQDLTLGRILPWLPWIMVFIAGNAFNEELLFRGLFLRKLEELLGKQASNLALAVPFVLHHTGVTYTNDSLLFLAYLLPLALAWGWLIQKTDSLWASVLFHAGTDIPVALVIFSQLN